MAITIKTPAEIEMMAEAGKRLAHVLEVLVSAVRVGMRTEELDLLARKLIQEAEAIPVFLGYHAPGSDERYPAALCVSINETVVHGIPSGYEIRERDVVKIDAGLTWKDWNVDSARTVIAGKGTEEAKRLLKTTHAALMGGIRQARPGNTLGDIGAAIQKRVEEDGFSIVEKLCGHGIGKELHEEPSVLNTGVPGRGLKLLPGMVLAIEPMVAAGRGKVKQFPDDSFAAADGSITAHFEHTVAITESGPRILTSK
ncbi:MAG: type I methionyl aminopeptidase [Candidatus Liptonbacteria bacterium]|nr:type I methionyl aminopeptidase [Candidatus Liptonbacteria bacterium]